MAVRWVRISHSIWCRTLPPKRGHRCAARRGEPAVLLTAFALQVIHAVDGHQIPVDEVLNDTSARQARPGYAGSAVPV